MFPRPKEPSNPKPTKSIPDFVGLVRYFTNLLTRHWTIYDRALDEVRRVVMTQITSMNTRIEILERLLDRKYN